MRWCATLPVVACREEGQLLPVAVQSTLEIHQSFVVGDISTSYVGSVQARNESSLYLLRMGERKRETKVIMADVWSGTWALASSSSSLLLPPRNNTQQPRDVVSRNSGKETCLRQKEKKNLHRNYFLFNTTKKLIT